MDEHNIEKKENAGQSTQYLLLVHDEDRAQLTIDSVLALYLIDLADLVKHNQPVQPQLHAESASTKQGKKEMASKDQYERNNYEFYMTACCFVQLYRACINNSINYVFKNRSLNLENDTSDDLDYT